MLKRKTKKAGVQTPEFRKPTPPPPPTSGSNAVKPNPNYVPPASVKKSCPYELPCGWCIKWDKKCDKKIGCEKPTQPYDNQTTVNKVCLSESDHEWECCGISTGGSDYRCKKCYAHKLVPYATTVLETNFSKEN